jgi:hypothetical protein
MMDACRTRSRRTLLVAAGAGFALLLAACATTTPSPQPLGAPVEIEFIHDGVTTKGDCVQRLGTPSKTITTTAGGEVLTYWIGRDQIGLRAVASWSTFEHVRYSLVLSFDAGGVLVRHSMVKIWER